METKSHRCSFSIFLLAFILTAGSGHLFAGDIASFMNLGFSPDGSTFMFGQYGIHDDSSKPYAESYIVDVAANEFVPGGTAQFLSDNAAQPGQDGIGALFNLVGMQHEIAQNYEIDHLRSGRLVYLYINGSEPRRQISFRDFNTGNSYTIELVQNVRGGDENPEAAFHINLNSVSTDGTRSAKTIGLPNYYRKGINDYNLKQVLVSPDEQSVIIVVEKILDDEDGRYLRYMVETARLSN
ncbi:DUF2259 domain-containing protein [Salinispira pacifica]|uniref:DUF2259 domain-containing protein n=1 Tax=Salinispira pacifica TaxID=1307761 RepID=V5WD40_9SPIO|nr:DUF2259 domain-containing protein [Salinispira pacifica]AHC13484.1 hypothetical protein L21SP2_0038 [Salinispira pacifica]